MVCWTKKLQSVDTDQMYMTYMTRIQYFLQLRLFYCSSDSSQAIKCLSFYTKYVSSLKFPLTENIEIRYCLFSCLLESLRID